MSKPKCDCGCISELNTKSYLHWYCPKCKKVVRKLTLAEGCGALLHPSSRFEYVKDKNGKNTDPID